MNNEKPTSISRKKLLDIPFAAYPGLGSLEKMSPRYSSLTPRRLGRAALNRVADPGRYLQHRRITKNDYHASKEMDLIINDKSGDISSFLQVGAHNGSYDDPYARFIEKYSWKSLLIEPQAEAFKDLTEKYAETDNVECFRAAVSEAIGEIILYKATLLDSQYREFGTAIASTSDEQVLSEVKRCLGKNASKKVYIDKEVVPSMPLGSILDEAGWNGEDIDFIAIDTEGSDALVVKQVIQDLDLLPEVICYEKLHLANEENNKTKRELAARGYKFAGDRYEHHKDVLAYQ